MGDARDRSPAAPDGGSDPLRRGLQLFALCGIAVAAPLFDLLARQPQFLIAHGTGGPEVAALILALVLGLPLGLLAAEQGLAAVSPRAAGALHLLLLGGLVAATCLPPLIRGLPDAPGWLQAGAAAAAGLAAAVAYRRYEPVRLFASALAIAPPVLAGLFFIDPSITKVRRDGEAAFAAAPPLPTAAPVVWIVFDELPLVSLLDGDGAIDAGRYPHFAALAGDASWYRNTATVAEYTDMAVPAMLTGRYPDSWRLPIASDHPVNLFSLFERSHELHVVETRTFLARRDPERHAAESGPRDDAGTLAGDLGIVFAHLVTPVDLRGGLPTISEDWKDFAGPAQRALPFAGDESYSRRLADFERFRRGVGACADPCLYFAHVLLPHAPWRFTPEGKLYAPDDVFGIGSGKLGIWSADPWWALQGYQRHLFQVAFADRLLGRVVAALRDAGLYDRSLVVVTSDHGASFRPGSSRRQLADHRHPADILRVPLFLKAPGQRRGAVRDIPIETVDILPTAAAALGVRLPFETDGSSAAEPGWAGRGRRSAFSKRGRRHSFAELDIASGLAWKLENFGSGPDPADLYRLGPYRALVGRTPGEFELAPGAGLAARLPSEPFAAARQSRGRGLAFSPARLSGRVTGAEDAGDAWVALAFDGAVRAVAPSYRLAPGRRGFSSMLPDGAETSDLAVYLVSGPPAAPVLRPAAVQFAPEQAELAGELERHIDASLAGESAVQ